LIRVGVDVGVGRRTGTITGIRFGLKRRLSSVGSGSAGMRWDDLGLGSSSDSGSTLVRVGAVIGQRARRGEERRATDTASLSLCVYE